MKIAILFTTLCLTLGFMWFVVKIGVMEAPPLAFAGSRLVCAGLLLLAFVKASDHRIRIAQEDYAKVTIVSVLFVTLFSGFIYWGVQYVSASLTTIIVQGVIPIALPMFSMIYRQEELSYGNVLSMFVGLSGLFIIFWPNVTTNESLMELIGLVAIITGTISYCWGSVLSKGLMSKYSVITLSGFHSLIGGIILLLVASFFEKSAFINTQQYLTPTVLYSWISLVFIGILGITIYMYLLKTWGAAKLSLYAFITPIVAIFLDFILLDDVLLLTEAIGTALIFVAVWISLRPPFQLAKKIPLLKTPEG